MSSGELGTYRRKRDAGRTPEPMPPEGPLPTGGDDTFVIQEHHASSLHWDLRLERGGVLVSWAVPKNLPPDEKTNHLAVRTEDHPMEYAAFEGEIPKGEYGAGRMHIWDRGTYETEKWSDKEVKVVLHGSRARGRHVLIHTGGKNWLVHRMDPPEEGYAALPELVRPMLAVPREELPPDDARWAYEMKWDGVRAVVYVEGGRPTVRSRNDRDVTAGYPELRGLAASLGSRRAVLDGEIVAFDERGRPSFGLLQARMHVTNAGQVRRLAETTPVTYLVFDVLHLDGHSTLELPYTERREILESLGLEGPRWHTPPAWHGGGAAVLAAAGEQGLEGVIAKRLDSRYDPGRRSDRWVKVKPVRAQEVVICGWKPGQGRRADTVGSLLLGIPGERGLEYAGHVGTGFTDVMLRDLAGMLRPLERGTSPFADPVPRPDARDAHWVEPTLVGEVRFGEWTRDGRLRHPSWRGLRPDKSPSDVVRSG